MQTHSKLIGKMYNFSIPNESTEPDTKLLDKVNQ